MKLVNDAALARMREIGQRGLQTRFTHLIRTVDENDYGDSNEAWADAGDHMGWLRQMNTPVIVAASGMAAAIGMFRVFFSVDVEIDEGDMLVEWNESGEHAEPDLYMVQSTNKENTYRVYNVVTVRKRK